MVFILRPVCGCRGLIQFALISSRFEWVAVAILVVHSSACPAVLCPLLDLVVLPTLHSPVVDSLPFLFFLLYCLSYFFFLSLFFFHICTVLQGSCSYEAFWQAMTRGFLLDCSSRIVFDTVVIWLGASAACLFCIPER